MRQLVSRMMCCGALLLLPSAVFAATSLVTVGYSNGVDMTPTITTVTVTLTNTNTLYPLKINSINNFTANASLSASIATNSCNGATLAATTGTCTFTVRFNAPTTQGVGAFSFSLSANDRIYPQVYSEPVAVFYEKSLTGTANPSSIVVDSSSTVWFTESAAFGSGKIGILNNGNLSECSATNGATSGGLTSIALDPAASLVWFTELLTGGIADFASISATTFAAGATCTGYARYALTNLAPVTPEEPVGLIVQTGTPEHVWMTNFNAGVTAGNPTGGTTSLFYMTEPVASPTPTIAANYYYNNPPFYNSIMNPWALIVSHDNNYIWFTDKGTDSIGKLQIASPNTLTETALNSSDINDNPQFIVLGSDTKPWFTLWQDNAIGTITTTSGVITKYSVPTANSDPNGIAANTTTGAIWFTELNTHKIATFNLNACTATACSMTEYTLPTANVDAVAIAIDPNNSSHIWFTESNSPTGGSTVSKIGELITTALP